jgi:dTDP-4-dehydrorhamnose reductase
VGSAATAPWVVAGCYGQLGSALTDLLERRGVAAIAVDLDQLDIADAVAVEDFLAALSPAPGMLVNAAAFTHVDRCEREPEAAERANAVGPGVLAQACRAIGAGLVHVSTDYVFSGDAEAPYAETDPTDPRCVYGRTKLAGEQRVLAASPDFLVVRTSWVFGRGRNFIAAILDQAERRRSGEASGPLRVVDDQLGRPTWAVDLAEAIAVLVEAGARGLYHVANDGIATWWDVARLCLDETGHGDLDIERISTDELDLPARRPSWSVLDCSRAAALGVRMQRWEEAVRSYLHSADSPLAGGEEPVRFQQTEADG